LHTNTAVAFGLMLICEVLCTRSASKSTTDIYIHPEVVKNWKIW